MKRLHLPVVDQASAPEADGAPASLPGESPRAAINRRQFLRSALGGAACAMALSACGGSIDDLFRRHFHELTPAQLKDILARLEQKYSAKYGKAVHVGATRRAA